jgi:glycosyltransferase involved in cell wall biosynthesis
LSSPLSPALRTTTPTVSVVIPTYNRSAILPAAIESVLRQTYTDYELIVIDDGSTDDTRDRLKPYMGRIRYFYQDNRGASAAQNKGIELAIGKWVSILASDDVWLPTKLERQFETLATLGSEFGACFTNCNYSGNPDMSLTVFEEGRLKTNSAFGPLCNPTKYVVAPPGSATFLPCLYVQSLVVLRSLLNEVGGFDEALGFSEDRDLLFRLSFRTKFCFVSTPLVSINRSPALPRLTSLLAHKHDQSYVWLELVLKKMLARPELVDREIRQSIQDELIALYYGGAAERLGDLRLAASLRNINKIRHMGHSYREIVSTLLSRARRKLSRTLRAGQRELS